MTCKETMRLICEYLEGKLASSVVRDLTRHLDHCKKCRIVLDAARRTLEVDFSTRPALLLKRTKQLA